MGKQVTLSLVHCFVDLSAGGFSVGGFSVIRLVPYGVDLGKVEFPLLKILSFLIFQSSHAAIFIASVKNSCPFSIVP